MPACNFDAQPTIPGEVKDNIPVEISKLSIKEMAPSGDQFGTTECPESPDLGPEGSPPFAFKVSDQKGGNTC